jgi:hypothetical protein
VPGAFQENEIQIILDVFSRASFALLEMEIVTAGKMQLLDRFYTLPVEKISVFRGALVEVYAPAFHLFFRGGDDNCPVFILIVADLQQAYKGERG